MQKSLWIILAVLVVAVGAPVAQADFQYTVTWDAVPGVMNQAIFQFTEPTLATFNETVPAGSVTTISNPCKTGTPNDSIPGLYGLNTFAISLGCNGQFGAHLTDLTGTLSTNIGAAGQYSFTQGVLFYSPSSGGSALDTVSGTVSIISLSTVPEPGTLGMMFSALLGLGLLVGVKRYRGNPLATAA